MGHSRPLFLYFRLFNTVDSKQMLDKSLPMTGFEPRISGVGGDRSTNWATTTAQLSGFVCAFHPTEGGSRHKQPIYGFYNFKSNAIVFVFGLWNERKWQKKRPILVLKKLSFFKMSIETLDWPFLWGITYVFSCGTHHKGLYLPRHLPKYSNSSSQLG